MEDVRAVNQWSRAAEIARRTPESRNRLVDFLRAASILAVITGHWLLAAPYATGGGLEIGNMMELASFTKWLSWGFQVMPIFFLVGGFANAVSWRAAQRDGKRFGVWLDARLRRLLLPVLPLVAAWVVLALTGRRLGVSAELLEEISRIALIPIWFLAIYMLIVVLVPFTHAAWKRWGFISFIAPVALAIADDGLFFAGFISVGWLNYLFIWVAVHQLGYAWLDKRLPSPRVRLALGLFGLTLLIGLTIAGPYPIAMISVPDAAISNTLPPKLTLIALATAQAGLFLSAEKPMRRWLDRPWPWTSAVLLNGMIMTIYLWHSTALTLILAVAAAFGNAGLTLEPASGAWWLTRPIWLAACAIVLAGLMPLVARFERLPPADLAAAPWQQVTGALLACLGLGLLAYFGIGGNTPPATQAIAVSTPFVGALVAGLIVFRRATAGARS
jgi:hypothetical protein